MKKAVAVVLGILGITCIVGARFLVDYYQSLLLASGFMLLGVSVAILVINHYLAMDEKRAATLPLLRTISPAIADFHNNLLKSAFTYFGKDEFSSLIDKYVDDNGDPRAFTPEERNRVAAMVEQEYPLISPTLDRMENDLKELNMVIGWSLNPKVAGEACECRLSISRLRTEMGLGEKKDSMRVAEHFIDVSLHAHVVFEALREMAGLKDSEAYGE